MSDISYITDVGAGSGSKAQARSMLLSDAPEISLNGLWKFRLLPSAHELDNSVLHPAYDDSHWDRMAVPSHWVLQGDGKYGSPIYTNVQFPFPVDSPNVPDENPTGEYRRWVTIPPEWTDDSQTRRVYLRFEGVESRYRVWVNGVDVGVGVGSRLTTEFDISTALHEGENLVVVRVHQWSASSYVEDQDQWWLPGIFRNVTVVNRPVGGIEDLWLRADYDHLTRTGRVAPEIRASEEAFPITLTIRELDIEVTWHDIAAVRSVDVGAVEPWSAERPRLYDAVVSARGETVPLRVGFRTVAIVGDRFLVNGAPVSFQGVNRHETHPARGRGFDEHDARNDLIMMKQFNVNAIRTSHYPPSARLLDLADELGFWVILECDYETHGFEYRGGRSEWLNNPSDDPAWRDALLDRIERTVERDKNHPSIVMWSLGNESGTGSNLAAMSSWVHGRDPSRPVHYEGDYTGAYTDVYSRMYAPIPEVESIGASNGHGLLLGCNPAESARQRTKPFILCEYVHAMGNGPGAIDQYQELFDRYPRLHGGFVWEWRDHGLRTTTPDGTEFFAYGGDFGEAVHDGNFVMDGLVHSDGQPSPALFEWAAVVSPIRISLDATTGVTVHNLRHSTSTADLVFRWTLEHDGTEVASGTLTPDAPIEAGSSALLPLPEVSVSTDLETWLTVRAELSHSQPWADAGHTVATAQFDLTPPIVRTARLGRDRLIDNTATFGPRADGAAPETLQLGPATFRSGELVSWAERAVAGPRVELWRAPTDNDEGSGFGSYEDEDPWSNLGRGLPGPSHATRWRQAGLDRLVGRVLTLRTSENTLQRVSRWSAANLREAVMATETWSARGDSVVLRVDIEPTTGWEITWPRVGIRFDLGDTVERVSWFGTGPRESYPDSSRAALVGRYDADWTSLTFPYARPQESGHRSALRSLDLFDSAGSWLRIDAAEDARGRLPGFSLSRHTAQQLSQAAHQHELPHSRSSYLYIDAAQNGLGSRACGPDIWPDFTLRPEARTIVIAMSHGQQ